MTKATIKPGRLFLISAPSGAGKTSLVNALLTDSTQKLCVSVSHTTRAMRPGEVDGINYHFVNKDEFLKLRNNHDFLEYAEVFGNFYGTSKSWVESRLNDGWDVILEIDWQGAKQVQALMPNSISLFILPPSLETLRERLTFRGQDGPDIINARMAEAVAEISHFEQASYLVVNDDFDQALNDIQAIMSNQPGSSKLQTAQQKITHKALLSELLP